LTCESTRVPSQSNTARRVMTSSSASVRASWLVSSPRWYRAALAARGPRADDGLQQVARAGA
jgi:hypothetical protein